MIFTLLLMVPTFRFWNHESCIRDYSKHFSCGNSLLPAKKDIVPVLKKKNKKKKNNTHKKNPQKTSDALDKLEYLLSSR